MKDGKFLCDECDGEIGEFEEYIEFQGMNYCQYCFDDHRCDTAIEEEGTTHECSVCGKEITGEYYKFDDEIFCVDCVEDNKNITTVNEKHFDYLADKKWKD